MIDRIQTILQHHRDGEKKKKTPIYFTFWERVHLLKIGSERIGYSLMQREGSILALLSCLHTGCGLYPEFYVASDWCSGGWIFLRGKKLLRSVKTPNAMPMRVLMFFSYRGLQYCEPIICLVLYIWYISLDVAVPNDEAKGTLWRFWDHVGHDELSKRNIFSLKSMQP